MESQTETCPESHKPRGHRFPRLIVAAFTLLATLLVFGAYRGCTDVEIVEHARQAPRWLPDAASNVSYYRSYLFTAAEFDISEKEFLQWAEKRGWPLSPVRDTVRIRRYMERTITRKSHPTPKEIAEYDALTEKAISHGYFFELRHKNGGGVRLAYDLDTGRGYFQRNSR
jgi:hypothetical protein